MIDKIMLNFDQPFLDSSAIPTYMVSQEAKNMYQSVFLEWRR